MPTSTNTPELPSKKDFVDTFAGQVVLATVSAIATALALQIFLGRKS